MIEFIRRILAGASNLVIPGSQNFTTPGTHNFTVPAFNTLTITLWGAGGPGGGAASGAGTGTNGTATTIASLGMSAGPGTTGGSLDPDIHYRQFASAGSGGVASGGNVSNTNGANGLSGNQRPDGGNAPGESNGGLGSPYWNTSNSGTTYGSPGGEPGAGGGGGHYDAGGNYLFPGAGGSGARCVSTFTPDMLPPGTVLTIDVGTGGPADASNYPGDGANGRATISWS